MNGPSLEPHRLRRLGGTRAFAAILAGQSLSRVGTALTRFGLLVWAYQQTGGAAAVALLGFFAVLPALVVGPVAGVWVDRLDRRKVMLAADLGAALSTLGLLGLHLGGRLAPWHLYLALLVAGSCEAFQAPAWTAATTLLVDKRHYARAAGLRALVENAATVLAPVLAGLLLLRLGLTALLLLDLGSFLFGLLGLALVRVPDARADRGAGGAGPEAAAHGFRAELGAGIRYLRERPGLLGLTLVFTGMNFFAALTFFSTLPAMILARSGGDALVLSSVQAAMGAAGVIGALVVSAWGGPKRRIHGVLMAAAASFLVGDVLMALGRGPGAWILGGFLACLVMPCIGASNEAIWQAKVAPAIQGRVFAARTVLGQALVPFGYLAAGWLAERWLEPAMVSGGSLAGRFGGLVGTGPGAGIALMFLITALCGAALCLSGYCFPAIRRVEDEVLDFEPLPRSSELRLAPAA